MMAGHTVSSLRTKELLASALRRQMEKKPLSRITVSDIMAETGLNRKTFYYHFEGIFALVRWMFEQETVKIIQNYDLLMDFPEVVQFIVKYVQSNRHILNCAYDATGRDGLRRFLYDDIRPIISRAIDSYAEKLGILVDEGYKTFLNELYTEALAGLLISLLRDQLDWQTDKTHPYLLYFEDYVKSTLPAAIKAGAGQ